LNAGFINVAGPETLLPFWVADQVIRRALPDPDWPRNPDHEPVKLNDGDGGVVERLQVRFAMLSALKTRQRIRALMRARPTEKELSEPIL
jgi:hypothetical protein